MEEGGGGETSLRVEVNKGNVGAFACKGPRDASAQARPAPVTITVFEFYPPPPQKKKNSVSNPSVEPSQVMGACA